MQLYHHPRWPVVLALGAWLLTAPALGQEQSPRPATPAPPGSAPADRAETDADRGILARIQQSFRENAELSDALEHIQISVTNGAVVLRGEVKNAEDKEAIEGQVRRIEGVQGVTNHLQVAGQ
jgi:osmotically-inducible protein OsmY